MIDNLTTEERFPVRYASARRATRLQLSTTIALLVFAALAVIAVSIGIAQADTLSAMIDDETGRLALLALIVLIAMSGTVTAAVMWLTAPARVCWRNVRRI